MRSDDGETKYRKPHWIDNDANGSADDAGERHYPLAFSSGAKVKAAARFV